MSLLKNGNFMINRFNKTVLHPEILIIVFFLFSCTTFNGPDTTLTMSLASDTDTISPLPVIRFALSEPIIRPDSIHFSIKPPFYSYHTILNTAKDTVTFVATELLEGNTRYTIILEDTLESETGYVLYPGFSTTINTSALEKEPNDRPGEADSLKSVIFGVIGTLNDTDCYVITAPARAVCVSFVNVKTGMSVTDSAGHAVTTSHLLAIDPAAKSYNADSLEIPADFTGPLIVRVYSYSSWTGPIYRLNFKE